MVDVRLVALALAHLDLLASPLLAIFAVGRRTGRSRLALARAGLPLIRTVLRGEPPVAVGAAGGFLEALRLLNLGVPVELGERVAAVIPRKAVAHVAGPLRGVLFRAVVLFQVGLERGCVFRPAQGPLMGKADSPVPR